MWLFAHAVVLGLMQLGNHRMDRRHQWDLEGTVTGAPLGSGLKLVLYLRWATIPPEPFLFLEGAGPRVWVNDLKNLKGLGVIRSADDAIRFVRLRSFLSGDPDVSVLRDPDRTMMEILSPKGYGAKMGELRGPAVVDRRKYGEPEGFAGIVLAAGSRKVADGYPRWVRDENGFLVTRFVVMERLDDFDGDKVDKITERVGADGTYRLVRISAAESGPFKGVHWVFPRPK